MTTGPLTTVPQPLRSICLLQPHTGIPLAMRAQPLFEQGCQGARVPGSQGAGEQRSEGAEENAPLHLRTSAPLHRKLPSFPAPPLALAP